MGWFYSFKPYVSVAARQAKAKREVAKLEKKGQTISPVKIEGRAIATTFWGKAWCDNLESYSDFENRLPRGRSYVRNGSVCDLQILPGRVKALVCGSELYRIDITVKPLPRATWDDVKARCAGQIASLVELLQGRLSKGVMEVVTARQGGLFPKPAEIAMKCSCPDWADVCKHVAAALYGVGSRLDRQPELLFALRGVDHLELVARAGDPLDVARSGPAARATIATDDLADVFGIELDRPTPAGAASQSSASSQKGPIKMDRPTPPGAAPAAAKPPSKAAAAAKKPRRARSTARRPGADARSGSAKTPAGSGKARAVRGDAPPPPAPRSVKPARGRAASGGRPRG